MSEWEFSDFASKDNLLRTVREQSDQMLALASAPDGVGGTDGVGPLAGARHHRAPRRHHRGLLRGHRHRAVRRHRAGSARRARHEPPRRRGRAGVPRHAASRPLGSAREGPRRDAGVHRGARRRAVGRPSWCRTSTWDRCRRSSTQWPSSSTTRSTPGTSAKARAGHTPSTVTPPTCSCRSASSCGSRPRTAPASSRSSWGCA